MAEQGCLGLLREVLGLSRVWTPQTLSDAAFLVWSTSLSLPALSRAAVLRFHLDFGGFSSLSVNKGSPQALQGLRGGAVLSLSFTAWL